MWFYLLRWIDTGSGGSKRRAKKEKPENLSSDPRIFSWQYIVVYWLKNSGRKDLAILTSLFSPAHGG